MTRTLAAIKSDAAKIAADSAADILEALKTGNTEYFKTGEAQKAYHAARVAASSLKDTTFKAAMIVRDEAAMAALKPEAVAIVAFRGVKAQKAVTGLEARIRKAGL